MEVTKSRFRDIEWFSETDSQLISIIGQGGTGSWTALFLSRLLNNNVLLHLQDMDSYDTSNMAGQFVHSAAIGNNKAVTLKDSLLQYTTLKESNMLIKTDSYKEGNEICPIVFSCVDNMKTRLEIFNTWNKLETKQLLIDPRLEAESFQIYVVTPGKEDNYIKTLFNDSEVPDLPCTLKQTTHIAALCAAYSINLYTNYLTNSKANMDIRNLPFNIKWKISNIHLILIITLLLLK